MTILYKPFQRIRTVLSGCFLLLALTIAVPTPSQAAGSLFTVDNVVADVTAENAIAAREKAFQNAQIKAFRTLAERMLPEGELRSFTIPDITQISTFIQDFEVRNEKLSSTRYSATYTFRFKNDDVRAFFSGSGAAYTDLVRKPMLILPFMETDEGAILWSDNNRWMKAWAKSANLDGLVPLIVPIGDLMDVRDIADDEALTYNPRRLSSMLRRYNADEAVITLARRQNGQNLEIEIYRTDRERPEYAHQVVQRISDETDANEAYAQAVEQVRNALRQDWKTKTVMDFAQEQNGQIQVHARFASLKEWARLQQKLRRVNAIRDIRIKALSPRDADLELTHKGPLERLKIALAQSDLHLQEGPAVEQGGLYAHFMKSGPAGRIYNLVESAGEQPPPAQPAEESRQHDAPYAEPPYAAEF